MIKFVPISTILLYPPLKSTRSTQEKKNMTHHGKCIVDVNTVTSKDPYMGNFMEGGDVSSSRGGGFILWIRDSTGRHSHMFISIPLATWRR